jgi:transcriptional regulator
MKKTANYYIEKIDNIIYRLYKYADETGVDVYHYAHQLTILQKSIIDKLNRS